MISRNEEADGRVTDRPTPSEGHEAVGPSVPLRPAPPLAKRLNRNALTVAAALAGITVITVLVVTKPSRSGGGSGAPPSGEAPAPVPAHPAFLDQPPKPLPLHDSDTVRGDVATSRAARGGLPAGGTTLGTPDAGAQMPVPPPLGDPTSILPVPGTIASGAHDGPPADASPRHDAYQSALTSNVLVGGQGDRRAHPTPPAAPAVAESHGPPSDGSTAEPSGATPAAAPAAAPASLPASLPPTVLRLDPAGSPYTVRAGTVVAGFLVTGINSDLPGEVLGQTSRDVFDSETQHSLLVPKGSRLIGTYDSRSAGTGRLIVAWTRLILPDGRSMSLPRLAGTDVEGQAGLHDEVDHHYGRVYGAALLTSALTAGVQLSQPQQSGLYAAPSTRQVAAGALGQTMGDVALESARRGLDVPPTIVIRPGQPFDVFLAGDLSFPAPYRPEYAAGP